MTLYITIGASNYNNRNGNPSYFYRGEERGKAVVCMFERFKKSLSNFGIGTIPCTPEEWMYEDEDNVAYFSEEMAYIVSSVAHIWWKVEVAPTYN